MIQSLTNDLVVILGGDYILSDDATTMTEIKLR